MKVNGCLVDWKIITDSKEVSGGIDIELTPQNDVVRFTILQFSPLDMVRLISKILNSESTGIEHATIYCLNDMDWEDKARAKKIKGRELDEGELFLTHDVIGETIIQEKIFDKILYDYSSFLLQVYKEDKNIPEQWFSKMEESLVKLKNRIDIESSL